MKKILVCLMTLFILSCSTRKKEQLEREKAIQKIFDYSDFVVHYPKNWTYNLGHGSIVYKPKAPRGVYVGSMIEIFKSDKPISHDLITNKYQRTPEIVKKIGSPQKVKTKFGDADMYKLTNIYEFPRGRETVTILIRFDHNNNSYNLRFWADKEKYGKYRKDIDYFIENLEFKK